ncbi:hypothetical protein [Bradyrhizobium sp. USDA 10063]
MFVPSAASLMNALSTKQSALNGNGSIEIPTRLLKMLLQIALAAADFDEEEYLRRNPDVTRAIERGEVESAKVHYIGYGYFEGRQGGGPEVDEEWYLQKYPDVASAVRERKVTSATDHFHAIGGGEGRSPNAEHEEDAHLWKKVLRGI